MLDYFKRGKYILLGHSYGAGTGTYFARLYPEYIEKIIGIDTIIPFVAAKDFQQYLTKQFDSYIQIHEKQNAGNRPIYTEKEVLEKIRRGRWGTPLTAEEAMPLVRRILEPTGKFLRFEVVLFQEG